MDRRRLFNIGLGHVSLQMLKMLSASLSMIVLAGPFGEKMGLITSQTGGILILSGPDSSLLFPLIFRLLALRVDKNETHHTPA